MNVYRILIMLFLTMCLFVAELTIGLITNSLALVLPFPPSPALPLNAS